MGLVLSHAKPFTDAGRVARPIDDSDIMLKPEVEITATRAVKTISDSIPSALIQTYSLLVAEEVPVSAIISIAGSFFQFYS